MPLPDGSITMENETPTTNQVSFSKEKLEELKNDPAKIAELSLDDLLLYAGTRASAQGDTSILPNDGSHDFQEGQIYMLRNDVEQPIRRAPWSGSASGMPRVQIKASLYDDAQLQKKILDVIVINLTTLTTKDTTTGKYRSLKPNEANKAASFLKSKIAVKGSVFKGRVSNDISNDNSNIRLINIIVE